jgi:hypothetical protein
LSATPPTTPANENTTQTDTAGHQYFVGKGAASTRRDHRGDAQAGDAGMIGVASAPAQARLGLATSAHPRPRSSTVSTAQAVCRSAPTAAVTPTLMVTWN